MGITGKSAEFQQGSADGGRKPAPLHRTPAPLGVLQLALRFQPSFTQVQRAWQNQTETRITTSWHMLSFAAATAVGGVGGSYSPSDYVKHMHPYLYPADLELKGKELVETILAKRDKRENTFRTFDTTVVNSLHGRLWRARCPDGTHYTLRTEPVVSNATVRKAESFHFVLWDACVPMPKLGGLTGGYELTIAEWLDAPLDPELDFGPYKPLHVRLIRRHARDNAVVAAAMAYIDGGTNVEASSRREEATHPPPTAEQIDAVILRAWKEPEASFWVGLEDKPMGYGSLWKCKPEHEATLLKCVDEDGNVSGDSPIYGMNPGEYVAWVSSLRILPEHRDAKGAGKRSGARVALAHSFERMLIAYAEAGVIFDHVWVKSSHEHERGYCRMLAGKRQDDEPLPEPLQRFGAWVCRLQLRNWKIREGKWTDLKKYYK